MHTLPALLHEQSLGKFAQSNNIITLQAIM